MMAKNDMRLSVNFIDHPKTKRLIRHTSFEGFYCLLKLWSYTAVNFPKGVLKHCDGPFIEEEICHWTGKAGELMDALSDEAIGFLEWDGEDWCVHDWEENQPWVFHADERSEQARKAVQARWGAREEEEKPKSCPKPTERIQPVKTEKAKSIDYQYFADQFNALCPNVQKVMKVTDKRRKALKAVIGEFGEERVIEAFSMVEQSDFLSGRETKWTATFDWLCIIGNMLKVLEGNYENKKGKKGFQKALKPRHASESGSLAVSPEDYNHE